MKKEIKSKLSNLIAGAGVSVMAWSLIAQDAMAQAVTPGGQAGFQIDPLEANVPIVDDTAVRDNLTNFNVWVNSIFTILSGVALAYFLYNVVRFALAKGPEDKEAARGAMIGGIIAMLVITGLWGILAFISSTIGVGQGGTAERIAI